MDIIELLKRYPKARPQLPRVYKGRYQEEYKLNREGASFMTRLSTSLEGWMHKKVAARQGPPTLEIGAGTLNQLAYEPLTSEYDIVEPFKALYEGKKELERVNHVYQSLAGIPQGRLYDRIISVAVLEHLTDLPGIVARSASLLKPGGWFQAAVPCEGELAWYLGWRWGTGPAYKRRTGLDYKIVMRHEHVNSLAEILMIIKYFFKTVRLSRYPLPVPHCSFYAYIEAQEPLQRNIDRLTAVIAPAADG